MPRFVILLHECPPDYVRATHYDLMLEQAGALHTWAMESLPNERDVVKAEKLADHRIAYLEYEGPLSDNRGTVTQWDSGEFEWLRDEPLRVEVLLDGRRLNGRLRIERTDPSHLWRVTFAPE
ncbi:MAG: hypothetical protein MI757_15705 [Pirellulales bacterium]|nr:hypothetical protein [Pirellulales bacterium]